MIREELLRNKDNDNSEHFKMTCSPKVGAISLEQKSSKCEEASRATCRTSMKIFEPSHCKSIGKLVTAKRHSHCGRGFSLGGQGVSGLGLVVRAFLALHCSKPFVAHSGLS